MHTANNFSVSLFSMFGIAATSSTVKLNDFIISVIFDILLFLVVYYVGKKTDWYGELKETS